ncbi:hypothetical protein [uncultured Friedmanniella sp.]|uniref:hypothetical protein n=1 Tax=uncultured Friedmanniella sp. TaxID=335381 RepID=UPI0035CC2094
MGGPAVLTCLPRAPRCDLEADGVRNCGRIFVSQTRTTDQPAAARAASVPASRALFLEILSLH